MIYLLCSNKILELDLKILLLKSGYWVREPSIFELPYLKFQPEDILIISKNLADKNPILHNIAGSQVIVISSLPYHLFTELNYPENYHYLSMPLNQEKLLTLLKEVAAH